MDIKDKNIAAQLLIEYLELWKLQPEGNTFYTARSLLQPVLYQGLPAMLKIAMEAEERKGALLMKWWNGAGAARVYQHDEQALLLERISGDKSLTEMSENGADTEATGILCSVAKQLHTPKYIGTGFELTPLEVWFKDLWPGAARYGGMIKHCAVVARSLLDHQNDCAVLHGDLHHQNVLYDAVKGWLAIDPKCLWGERAFDYANIFCNPNKDVALAPGRFQEQLRVVSEETGISLRHLLNWTIAWCGLSATWILDDPHEGETPEIDLGVARIAYDILQHYTG